MRQGPQAVVSGIRVRKLRKQETVLKKIKRIIKTSGGENTVGGFLMEGLNNRRIKIVLTVFTLVMALLAVRVWYIQISCHDELAQAAVSQYEIQIEGLDNRGVILDRNLRPLTGGTRQYYYIINKKKKDAELERLMEESDGRQLAKSSSSYYVYRMERYNEETNDFLKEKYGAYVFQSRSRYADDQIACHLIGYLNKDENIGVSGLELMCQEELADDGDTLTVWADGAGNILKGIAPFVTTAAEAADNFNQAVSMRTRAVTTTIDRRLQHVCESALAEAGEGGAVIVLNSDTGEIMAWASYPDFNPNDIAAYLEKGDCLIDKATQGAYAPGSVFKIVTAIAALESGVCDENQVFRCDGQITVEGVTVKCTAAEEEGHGELNMNQAMSCSCNCYFAQLGQMTGCGEIVKTAARLGLGSKALKDYPGETTGYIPPEEKVGPWDITNISIGQGAILTTPMQIARMTAIVACGGRDVEPVIKNDEGNPPGKRIISAETADKLDSMLRDVMKSGTGAGSWQLPVRGKTGTAEAVWEDQDVKNCWFTGYFDCGGNRYVITVLAERGDSGSATAMPVFKAAADFLSKNP